MASQTTTGKGALHPLTSGHEVQAANKTCVSFQLLSECTRLQNKSSAECNHMVSMSCAARGMPPYSQRLNIQQISQQKCKLTRLGQSKLIKSGLPQPTFHRNDLPQYSLKRNNVSPQCRFDNDQDHFHHSDTTIKWNVFGPQNHCLSQRIQGHTF